MTTERDSQRRDWQAAAEAREWTRGNKPSDPEPFPHAGVVEEDRIRRVLTRIMQSYDPDPLDPDLPGDVRQTELYQRLLRSGATETLTRSIHDDGKPLAQSYFVGDPAARSDISGIKAIEDLKDMILRSAPLVYIFGEPGSGKTNFALLLAQLWKREYEDGEIGTNIRTWEESDDWIPNYGRLDDWLSENIEGIDGGGDRRTDGAVPKLFVFDEASSHASGRGAQGHETGEKLGPLVYKIRKANAGIVIIGHDGRDVHPAIRTLATVVERERGKLKEATLWEDVRNREGRGKIMDLKGIPQTDYTYDDGEATSWSWDDRREGEELVPESDAEDIARDLAEDMTTEQIRRFAAALAVEDNGLTQEQIGRAIGLAHRGEPYKQNWVSKYKNEYEDGIDDLGVE